MKHSHSFIHSLLIGFILISCKAEYIDNTPPQEVTNLTIQAGYSSISLSWENPVDSDFYSVQITQTVPENASEGTMSVPVIISANNYLITGLTPNVEYKYTICTLDKSLNVSKGISISGMPMIYEDATVPDDVTNFNSKEIGEGVLLTWDDSVSEDLDYYLLDWNKDEIITSYRTISSEISKAIRVSKGIKQYYVPNLTYGEEYIFTIKAVDYNKNISTGVNTSIVMGSTNITPVKNFCVNLERGYINCEWEIPENDVLKNIILDVKNKNSHVQRIYLGNDINNCHYSDCISGEIYDFEIYTIDNNGCKSPSMFASKLFVKLDKQKNIPLVEIITTTKEDPVCEPIQSTTGWGAGITNNDYVTSQLLMTLNNEIIYDSGEYVKGTSGAKIKIRGNTSAYGKKKPYKIKLEKKDDLLSSVLGRSDKDYKDKEWLLLKADNLNTVIGFETSKYFGIEWEPSYCFVNLIMNGEYKGFYLLTEAITKGKKRINISDDGYIIENDAYFWNEEVSFRTDTQHPCMGYTFKYPDTDKITSESLNYIKSFMDELDGKIYVNVFDNLTLDYYSSASWLLSHDVLGTGDWAGSNMYLVKYDSTDESKIKMGPAWDFDAIYHCDTSRANITKQNMYYPIHLIGDASFNEIYLNLWNQKKDGFMNEIQKVYTKCNDMSSEIDFSFKMDSIRYGNVKYATTSEEITRSKNWFTSRIEVLDSLLQQ